MNTMLLMISAIILLCIILNIISGKIGVPVLLAFILLGMVFGSEGIFKIRFDDFKKAETICSFALIFIMFYGGFGTNINEAKPIALKAGLLSSIGVLLTSVFVALFSYFNVCSCVCLLCPEIFMDKLGTDRCGNFFNRCGKCILNITRQTSES